MRRRDGGDAGRADRKCLSGGTKRADILDRIGQNSPAFFERLIVDLLVAMGYGGSHKNAAAQLGRSGDGGVDGVINEDRLGLDRCMFKRSVMLSQTLLGDLMFKDSSAVW
ncbi:MAG: hypothetical protein E5Y58_00095 [Mesorhizobium sp.]|nr:MAG: hypothetical protein E5Y58_00095 [Mesorhizobium sp.]